MATPEDKTQTTDNQISDVDRQMNAEALDVAGDDVGGGDNTVAADNSATTAPDDFVPEKASPIVTRNSIRDQIAKSFRETRAQESQDAQHDMEEIRALTNNGLPAEFQDQVGNEDVGAVVDAANQQQQPVDRTQELTPPSKIKVKINGEERELTQEEVIAAAQKSLAGDDYLGRAKKEAKDLIDGVRTEIEGLRAAASTTQNQGSGETAQPGATDATAASDENHVDPVVAVIEKLQFGDPAEAATSLRQLIESAGREASQREVFRQRREMELTRSKALLQQFSDANPDVATDDDMQALLRVQIFKLQREDLVKTGADPKTIPADPDKMANVHLDYRTLGANVRSPSEILDIAKANVEKKWNRTKPQSREAPGQQQEQQQQNSKPAAPRVEVNVNRTARRQEIIQQPTRTMAPRPDARPQERRDGSTVVQRMQQVRQAPRQGRGATPPA